MRTTRLAALSALAIAVTGCPVPTPSDGTLDESGWVAVGVGGRLGPERPPEFGVAVHDLSTGSVETYVFQELETTSSADINPEGLLATVHNDGVVGLSRFGTAGFIVERDVGASGVAWSNRGDRLAVVSSVQDERSLSIVDTELRVLAEFPGIPIAHTPIPYSVSWSGDDRMIAVSKSDAAVLIDLSLGTVEHIPFGLVLFLGSDEAVALDPSSRTYSIPLRLRVGGDAVLLRIAESGVEVTARVPAWADEPVSSDARQSHYLAFDQVPASIGIPREWSLPPVRLRDSTNNFGRAHGNLEHERGRPLLLVRASELPSIAE